MEYGSSNADRLGACPGTSAAFFRFRLRELLWQHRISVFFPCAVLPHEKEHAYEDH